MSVSSIINLIKSFSNQGKQQNYKKGAQARKLRLQKFTLAIVQLKK